MYRIEKMDENIPFWFYMDESSLSPELSKWTKYRDIEMEIIEEAYQQGKSEVFLDKYRIDLKNFVQFNQDDSSKQVSVKREMGCNRKENLREERFFSELGFSIMPSYGAPQAWCPFLNQWLSTSAGKKALMDFSYAIDACAEGIVIEAVKHNSSSETEAKWMAERLRACKTKPRSEVSELCVNFYTRESFLYRVLNTAIRDADYTKLHTMGPLCFIMRHYARTHTEFKGTVYRGVYLSSENILSYKQGINTWHTWPSFSSTSKNRKVAELKGNTLLIINIIDINLSNARAFDISSLSQFPDEDEVLLPAGVSFQVINVTQDQHGKHIIELNI